MDYAAAQMIDSPQVIWLRSEEPDPMETEVLTRISSLSVVVVQEVREAAELSRSGGVKLVVANFSEPDQAITAVERLRCDNESTILFVRDPFASSSDVFALARLGVARIFGAEYDVDRISDEIEIALEDITSQHSRNADRERPGLAMRHHRR